MILNMSELATAEEIERVVERIEQLNYTAHVNRQERRTVIGVAGASVGFSEAEELRRRPGVETVVRASQPFTLDLAAVARVKELSHLPVLVDPSHGTGRRSLVPAASRAAVAVGADGLMIEVHPDPERALSDGPQSLTLEGFAGLMQDLRATRHAASGGRAACRVEHHCEEVGELV